MTKEEALQLVTNVCRAHQGTFQDHVTIDSALKVLWGAAGVDPPTPGETQQTEEKGDGGRKKPRKRK